MRGIKLIGIILGLAAIGMFAATSASASAPEFGRCLKQATKSLSNFDNAKCVKLAGEDAGTEAEKLKKGNYQWFSGVVNNKFTTKLKAETTAQLQTTAGTTITCHGETSTGEYTSSKEVGKVLIKFTGCESSSLKCESVGAGSGNINWAALAGTLGFETITEGQPAKDHLALELHAEAGGNIAEFSCGGVIIVVRGSVLHRVVANAMKLTTTEKFVASMGKQKPDHFAGGVPGEHILEESIGGKPFEQTGVTITTILTNEEKVEASTIN
jgi:hypothetical protein